jgi:hypothetical protein
MARISAKRVPIDPARIDIDDSSEVRYWCRKFGCTQSDLRAAVKVLGPSPTEVQKYLKQGAANA